MRPASYLRRVGPAELAVDGLLHVALELLGDLGISNVVTSPEAAIVCRSGAVAAYLLGR